MEGLIDSTRMHREKQQSPLRRSTLVVAVVFAIALLLLLSLAVASGAGHSFDHISLSLPVFFFLFLLTFSAGERLWTEDPSVEPQLWATPTHSRAPPAPLS